ncbi:MAG TPA: response regulator transcription factor [Pseudonocardiaceae bacterium]|nr:response regulator transcription factor [Pseudonocardiaceae bacterium]
MLRILLVEDDDSQAAALVPGLARRSYAVDRLPDGRHVLDRLVGVDVVLLDMQLPDVDGNELCGRIRAISDVPIIMMSAYGDVTDRILALHSGADDFVRKPYDEGELVARIHAVLRRRDGAHPPVGTDGEAIVVGDVEIHLTRRTVVVAGEPVELSRDQFRLLAFVAGYGGAVCTNERIVAEVWPDAYPVGRDVELDEQVGAIRAAVGRAWLVRTVQDVGYQLGWPPARRGR